ncbi:MAG TPA: hypothetical protein VHN79_03645 [Lacunisphaera sp.]|nr:hypothetical protein [Lacunisphaera sp.]
MIGAAAPVVAFARPVAPATFHAWQSGMGVMPDFELWNLTADIPRHPKDSTLSRQTLESYGYTVPPAPVPAPSLSR